MARLQWDSSLDTGDARIDGEHRHLFEVFNDLQQSSAVAGEPADLSRSLRSLTEYAAAHFAHEEERMRATAFPKDRLDEHLAEHVEFSEALRFHVLEFDRDRLTAADLIAFLRHWLAHHVREIDRIMVEHLRESGDCGATTSTDGVPPVALRETCRVVRLHTGAGLAACIPLWRLHRERLSEGGCGEVLLRRAEQEALRTIASHERSPSGSRLRLSLTLTPAGQAAAELADRLSSLDVPGGPTVGLVEVGPVPSLPPGAAKPAKRTMWDEAMRAARPAQQALLVDREGFVIDGGTSTVWALLGGRLVTPPAPPAVAGVSRRFLLAHASELGVPVAVEPLPAESVLAAEEIFLSNAFGGAVAARGRGGEAASRAGALFSRLWTRR